MSIHQWPDKYSRTKLMCLALFDLMLLMHTQKWSKTRKKTTGKIMSLRYENFTHKRNYLTDILRLFEFEWILSSLNHCISSCILKGSLTSWIIAWQEIQSVLNTLGKGELLYLGLTLETSDPNTRRVST